MSDVGHCGEAAAGGPCGRRQGHEGHHATIAAHHLDETDDLRGSADKALAAVQAEAKRLRAENERLTGWLRENKAEAVKAWTEVHRLRERVASLEVYAITCDRSLRAAGLSAASEVPEITPAFDDLQAPEGP